ncbi:hypothetical protein MNBD_BACTEROID01-1136 [hydrothermal vent metagenome]|uniref:Uncharacterized protein n=1 Tax=hydrothermal vent metagenome TaxID=652676 RepID=A0A3B0UKN4_9ZZZZ
MFKKAIHITLALVFILSIRGVTVQQNFCDNEMISTYFGNTSEECCENPCSFCHIKIIVVKVTDSIITSVKKSKIEEQLVVKCPFLLCADSNITHFNKKYSVDLSNTLPLVTLSLNRAQLQVYLC